MSTNQPTTVSEDTATDSTIILGIQNISAFLPVLGTEQCEEHVSNTLDRGWLYAAAAPMSMFGSLGILKAGVYTLLVSTESSLWHGPRKLRNLGFLPKGVIGILAYMGDTNDSMSIAEDRMRLILERYPRIDKITFNIGSLHWFFWEMYLGFSTVFFSSLGLTSFAYVIKVDLSDRPFSQTWLYPLMRVYGCALATTMTQGVIQSRILAVVHDRLQFHVFTNWFQKNGRTPPHFWKTEFRAADSLSHLKREFDTGVYSPTTFDDVLEKANVPPSFPDCVIHSLMIYRIVLFCALAAGGIGYLGCFCLIQASNSVKSTGPGVWLALEVALCIARLYVWAYKFPYDNPPPLMVIQRNDRTGNVIYEVGWTLGHESTQDVHGMIIGNSATSADNAEKSANSIYLLLLKRFAVPENQFTLLQGADSNDIERGLQALATDESIKFGASFIVYLACHVEIRAGQDGNALYFMTADYGHKQPDTGLSYKTFLHLIQDISHRKGNHIIVILDTCCDTSIECAAQYMSDKSNLSIRLEKLSVSSLRFAYSPLMATGIIESEYGYNYPSHVLIATWSEHHRHGSEIQLEGSKGPSNPNCTSRPLTKALQTVMDRNMHQSRLPWLTGVTSIKLLVKLQTVLKEMGVENQNLVISGRQWQLFLHFNNLFGGVSPEAKSMVLLTINETSQAYREDSGQTAQ